MIHSPLYAMTDQRANKSKGQAAIDRSSHIYTEGRKITTYIFSIQKEAMAITGVFLDSNIIDRLSLIEIYF